MWFMMADSIGLKVGDVIDGMYKSGEFGEISIEKMTDVVHTFLKEYVGFPGTIITRKFNIDAVREFSNRFGLDVADIVKIITVFKLKSTGKGSNIKHKFMKSFSKSKIIGGGRSGVKCKM